MTNGFRACRPTAAAWDGADDAAETAPSIDRLILTLSASSRVALGVAPVVTSIRPPLSFLRNVTHLVLQNLDDTSINGMDDLLAGVAAQLCSLRIGLAGNPFSA